MSKEHPILKNAPITEALIDIRVKLPSKFDVIGINSIHDSIKKQYSGKQELRVSGFEFQLKDKQAKRLDEKIEGYRYISSDNKQIIQTRLNGFTFNRLYPYISWKEFRNEAHSLWQLYKKVTSPESITRVAVRYINNLKIPMPMGDFSEYLTAPPIVPDELPQGVSSFLTRVVIHEPSIGANAIITQVLEQVATDVAPIILDIDVYKLQPKGIEEKDVWETIEKLRHFKNKIFFNSITHNLKEMYK